MKCSNCGGEVVLDNESGEWVCTKCGLVLPERVEERASLGSKSDLLVADLGASSTFGSHDFEGRALNVSKMKRLDGTAHRGTTKSFMKGLKIIRAVCEKLSLPKHAIEESAYIFRKAMKQRHGGYPTKGLALGSVFAAVRELGIPRTMSELALVSKYDRIEIYKYYKVVVLWLGIKPQRTDPKPLVQKIATRLGLDEALVRKAWQIIDLTHEKNVGRKPIVVAASAVYLSTLGTSKERTQMEVAEASGVTDVGLRVATKAMREALISNVPIGRAPALSLKFSKPSVAF